MNKFGRGKNIYYVSGAVLDARDTMGSKIYIFLDLQGVPTAKSRFRNSI